MAAPAGKLNADSRFTDESELIAALNKAMVDMLSSVPFPVVEQAVRKWVDPGVAASRTVCRDCSISPRRHRRCCICSRRRLSGMRPVDRFARAAAAQGGVRARALAALAASKFRLFHVEAFGPRDLATARDCVTGATFELVCDSLSPILLDFDVATRLCPLGEGVFWPMGPIVPVGPHGEGRAARFPTRPGKGLINEGNVAQQLYREYVRAGAPFGVNFGLQASNVVTLTFVDPDLADYADAVRERSEGPEPTGELLAQLRGLVSMQRLASALNCAVELAAGGEDEGAAIYPRGRAHPAGNPVRAGAYRLEELDRTRRPAQGHRRLLRARGHVGRRRLAVGRPFAGDCNRPRRNRRTATSRASSSAYARCARRPSSRVARSRRR